MAFSSLALVPILRLARPGSDWDGDSWDGDSPQLRRNLVQLGQDLAMAETHGLKHTGVVVGRSRQC